MAGVYDASGGFRVTDVSDNDNAAGLYAPDGSIQMTFGTTALGLYDKPHNCYRATDVTADADTFQGLYNADGSFNVVPNDGSARTGLYHPCGALNIVLQ